MNHTNSPSFSNPFTPPAPSPPTNPGAMEWPVFRDMYVESVKLRSDPNSGHPAHVDSVLHRFTRYTGAMDKRLVDITSIDLVVYLRMRKSDSIRPVTINNEIRILNAAFAKAGPKGRGRAYDNWGLIPEPPYAREFPEPRTFAVVTEEQQLRRFLEAAAAATTPSPEVCNPALFWRAVILLELTTRLRRRALLNVPRPSDRDLLDRRVVILPAAFNKTREDLVFPLGGDQHGEQIARIVAELPTKEGQPLLPWQTPEGKRMTDTYFSFAVKKIQRAAGIAESDRFRLKDLRSTAGTLLADEFSDSVAKKALGHGPNTNTLNTNYKSRTVRDADRQASDFMASMAMKFLDSDDSPEPPSIVRFPGRSA